jgi:hypothetical protein
MRRQRYLIIFLELSIMLWKNVIKIDEIVDTNVKFDNSKHTTVIFLFH